MPCMDLVAWSPAIGPPHPEPSLLHSDDPSTPQLLNPTPTISLEALRTSGLKSCSCVTTFSPECSGHK